MLENNNTLFNDMIRYFAFIKDADYKLHAKGCKFKNSPVDVYKTDEIILRNEFSYHFNFLYGMKNISKSLELQKEGKMAFALNEEIYKEAYERNKKYKKDNKISINNILKSYVNYLPENCYDYSAFDLLISSELNCLIWCDLNNDVFNEMQSDEKMQNFIMTCISHNRFFIDNGEDNIKAIFGDSFYKKVIGYILKSLEDYVKEPVSKKLDFFHLETQINNLVVLRKNNLDKSTLGELKRIENELLNSLDQEDPKDSLEFLFRLKGFVQRNNKLELFYGLSNKASKIYKSLKMKDDKEFNDWISKQETFNEEKVNADLLLKGIRKFGTITLSKANDGEMYSRSFIGDAFYSFTVGNPEYSKVLKIDAFINKENELVDGYMSKLLKDKELLEKIDTITLSYISKAQLIYKNYTKENEDFRVFTIKAIQEISLAFKNNGGRINSINVLYFSIGIIERIIDVFFDMYSSSEGFDDKKSNAKSNDGMRYRDREFKEMELTYSNNPMINMATLNLAYYLLYEKDYFGGLNLRDLMAHFNVYNDDGNDSITKYTPIVLITALSLIDEMTALLFRTTSFHKLEI